MSLEALLAFIRDVLVIGYMFVLRIGVPIMITLMIGAWLRRMLEKEDQPQPVARTENSLEHCWDRTKSQDAEQARTSAMTRPDLPCWLALQVGGSGLKEMCYSCPLYTATAPVAVPS